MNFIHKRRRFAASDSLLVGSSSSSLPSSLIGSLGFGNGPILSQLLVLFPDEVIVNGFVLGVIARQISRHLPIFGKKKEGSTPSSGVLGSRQKRPLSQLAKSYLELR